MLAEANMKKLDPETKVQALKLVKVSGILGSIVWGVVAVAAAIMLVGFGAWPWVVWPLAFYWWVQHVGRVVQTYTKAKKGEPKWEQNVTFNITNEMSPEEIAKAAERAMNEQSQYAGWAASGYRTEEELQSGR